MERLRRIREGWTSGLSIRSGVMMMRRMEERMRKREENVWVSDHLGLDGVFRLA